MRIKIAAVLGTLLIVGSAMLLGVGGYTFYYAKGYSYLSDNPRACINCHVMRDTFTAWEVSSHRSVKCNDCHLPHDLAGKYLAKAEFGFKHSFAFIFEDVQVFRLKPRGQEIVESNCIRCHSMTISTIVHDKEKNRCFDCHRGVGHSF